MERVQGATATVPGAQGLLHVDGAEAEGGSRECGGDVVAGRSGGGVTEAKRNRNALLGTLSISSRRRGIKIRLAANDPRCYYCRTTLTVEESRLDHYLPVSVYPERARDLSNLVLSCVSCDRAKGCIDPRVFGDDEFKQLIDLRARLLNKTLAN